VVSKFGTGSDREWGPMVLHRHISPVDHNRTALDAGRRPHVSASGCSALRRDLGGKPRQRRTTESAAVDRGFPLLWVATAYGNPPVHWPRLEGPDLRLPHPLAGNCAFGREHGAEHVARGTRLVGEATPSFGDRRAQCFVKVFYVDLRLRTAKLVG